jgi:hypothetical protein
MAHILTLAMHGPELPNWSHLVSHGISPRMCDCGAVDTGLPHSWHMRDCAKHPDSEDNPQVVPTHILTLALPGYPHPDARVEVPAVKVRRNVYRTPTGTIYTPNCVLAVREVAE